MGCIANPGLAPWAQIPLALVMGASSAPSDALGLVQAAVSLGADADALKLVFGALQSQGVDKKSNQPHLFQSQAEALRSERMNVSELEWLGVNMIDWTPTLDMNPP